MALLAEQEREAISSRTKAALAELKAKGVKLGCRRGHSNLTDAARAKAAQSKFQRAIEAANGALHHAQAYRAAGWTWRAIADQLNRSGLRTRTGKLHTIRSVRRLVELAERAGFEAPDPREAAEIARAVGKGAKHGA
jgi:DNA invertase Pin-like site-specific DNA recombinase